MGACDALMAPFALVALDCGRVLDFGFPVIHSRQFRLVIHPNLPRNVWVGISVLAACVAGTAIVKTRTFVTHVPLRSILTAMALAHRVL